MSPQVKHEVVSIDWRTLIRALLPQVSAGLGSLRKHPTHDILALRVYILHWVLDGILRMRGAHRPPPPMAERESVYRKHFETVNYNTPAEWRQQIADLYQDPDRDGPGVRTLVLLLVSLELLNAECRRREGHKTIRGKWEAITKEIPDLPNVTPKERLAAVERQTAALIRNWKVYKTPEHVWGEFDEPNTHVNREMRDGILLHAFLDLLAQRNAVPRDITVDHIPEGPFATLYPVKKTWWAPVAARMVSTDILASVKALHPKADDTLELFPLKAKDRLKEYAALFVTPETNTGPGALTDVFGHEFKRTTAGEHEPFVEEPDPAERIDTKPLERRVTKEWGRRMWRGIEARSQGSTFEEAAKEAKISRRTFERRLELVAEWAKEMDLR